MKLHILDQLPKGFLDAPITGLGGTLPGPALIDLPGRHDEPLFVSVLLHGNEDTGLLAMQEVLRRHQAQGLPRRLLLFVGNIAAAAAGVRTLPDQLDFNRAWPGTLSPDRPEATLMRQVVDLATEAKPYASIDIHNNTGLNPHYGCLNRLEPEFLHLARLFSRTVVYFEKPVGVQSMAMAEICPAVTVECGKTGDRSAIDHAAEFIEACLSQNGFPDHPPNPADFDLLRTFAVVKVPPEATFSFDGGDASFRFRPDIDHLNFGALESGTEFGERADGCDGRLLLDIEADAPVAEYFDYSDDTIRLRQEAIPAMLTRDPEAVRLDCLCYLMHHIDFEGRRRDG